jgi:hypothetical protein
VGEQREMIRGSISRKEAGPLLCALVYFWGISALQAEVASDRMRSSGARLVNELRCGGDKPEMSTLW